MEHRYSLRFESGERKGESIPITTAGLSVGRKPGNTLQILDNSVSGSHAELSFDGEGVLLKDTGSTNGTRVGNQRVLEQHLSDGDVVTFGNVRMTFRDAKVGAGGGAGSARAGGASSGAADSGGIHLEGFEDLPEAPSPVAAEDAVLAVDPALVAKAKKRSYAGGIVVLALALVGAGVWFWLNQGGGESAADTGRAVQSVDGNLIPRGYSFESDDDGWTSAEGASAAFVKTGSARRSGAFGVGADIEAGQWALHRSPSIRVGRGRELVARGFVRARGPCEARLGIELSNDLATDAAAAPAVFAWCTPVVDADDFGEVEIAATVPPGWTLARAVLLARSVGQGTGNVDADDVSIVDGSGGESGAGKPAATSGNASLYVLGDPVRSVQLLRGERVLVTQISTCTPAVTTEGTGAVTDPFDTKPVEARADGLRFFVELASGATAMQLRAEEPLVTARVATVGVSEGYTTHGLAFERAGVDALLLGSGADLVRVKLEKPSLVKGQAEGVATRITIVPAQRLEMQLDFSAERKEGGNLAYAARNSESSGNLGDAVVQWTALLDGYPFEDALVNEAEAARSRLVQKGLEELRRVQAEIERARFFRLADLYKKCRDDALAVGKKYAKSEVEAEARKIADAVNADIAALEVDLHKAERERMKGILSTLEARKATGLAAEVRQYLDEKLADPRSAQEKGEK
jgi:hypothetical protein